MKTLCLFGLGVLAANTSYGQLLNTDFESNNLDVFSRTNSELDFEGNISKIDTEKVSFENWVLTGDAYGLRTEDKAYIDSLVLDTGGLAKQVVTLAAGSYDFTVSSFNVKTDKENLTNLYLTASNVSTGSTIGSSSFVEVSDGVATDRSLQFTLKSAAKVELSLGSKEGLIAFDNAGVGATPEPSTALLGALSVGIFSLRRRR